MGDESKNVTIAEIKANVDAFMTAFSAFKETNDARLKQVEGRGEDPVTAEQLVKIEKTLDTFEDLNQRLTLQEQRVKDDGEQLDRIETALDRVGKGAEKEAKKNEAKETFELWCRKGEKGLTPEQLKVLTIADDTTGGYLAPSEYVQEIIKGIVEFSPVRSIARVRTTSARSVMHPKRTGQFSATWTAELGTRSETTGLTYGLEEIPTHEASALVDISAADLEDSAFNLEAELNMEFSERFGVAEGTAFVSGSAVGKPEGFLVNSDVGNTNTGDANFLTADGLISLFYAIKSGYAGQAVWTMARGTIAAIRKLKDGEGNYLWAAGLAGGVANNILGAPYVEMVDMPAVSAGLKPIMFGDFRRGYIIVDRISLALLRDPFTQATSGAIRFVARKRVGGQVVLAEALRTHTVSS